MTTDIIADKEIKLTDRNDVGLSIMEMLKALQYLLDGKLGLPTL